VVAVAGLVLVKEQNLLARAQIVGSCELVAPPVGSPKTKGQWWWCSEGRLTGYPTLDRGVCDREGIYRKREVWHCSTPIERPY
jgi:hypothetical protein